jgi:hypothetical protein
MAPFTFALLAILTASLASAGPVAIDNATLLLNGEQALLLNCQFQNFQKNDTCISTCYPRAMSSHSSTTLTVTLDKAGDTGCVQGETATCVAGAWQTLPCPQSKACFALPSVRTNGTVRVFPHSTFVVPSTLDWIVHRVYKP